MEYDRIVRETLTADRSSHARVLRLARWIAEDPRHAPGLDALAERAAMSRRNLIRHFVRVTGMAPSRYVERARVLLARRLLDETGLPAKSIAEHCGFRSGEAMRRAFHRVLGASPRECTAGPGVNVPPSRYADDVRPSGSNLRLSVQSTFTP